MEREWDYISCTSSHPFLGICKWNYCAVLLSKIVMIVDISSCKDRCGTEYYRGYMCQCDYSCLGYGECCKDYESQCTIKNSCKGRCGEPFKRGRLCSCDSDCLKYKQCCPDHKMHCDQGKTPAPPSNPQNPPQTPPQPQTTQRGPLRAPPLQSGHPSQIKPLQSNRSLQIQMTLLFSGHFFWFLDRNRVPGPARGITEAWGVPSPIDTVFTRCNCQGKTYIFKGPRYWRFENDALDPGYPKVVETGFDGLRGHITAALSVPQHKRRRESVYFFKRGGTVQKYSYQFGTNPSCGRRLNYAIYTVRNRFVRQAVSHLEPSINIRTSWKGFPTSITAAVSIPNSREPEGYSYYVFSRCHHFVLLHFVIVLRWSHCFGNFSIILRF
uniref:SMB domain-containing protein n=1 Tax=Sphaeramia orbicularis TaxID=375764 RepID=A0A672ZH26_9TELE